MSDFLDTIRRIKEEEIAVLEQETPIGELRARLRDLPPARDFRGALRKPGIALIAEVKKSSPSAGIISGELDPASIALEYESGGASAISVLTESTYFGGDLADLIAVKGAVKIPVLRKDFIIDPYQIYEARSAGADAILLIAELLDLNQLTDYLRLAHDLGLSCLVESHSRGELEKAIESGAEIIGVNNRNLKTLMVDIDTSIQLIPLIPPDRFRVAESGIKSIEDVERISGAGADAILVGEVLVRSENPGLKIGELIAPIWCFYKPMKKVKIKICGLTRPEDVLLLGDLSVDFAGFIFVPGTPRFMEPEKAAELIRLLPDRIQPVGVFLDEEPDLVRETADICGLKILQFHGHETPEYCEQFRRPYFKVIRVNGSLDGTIPGGYRPLAFLLDTFVKGAAGGTGKTFDWTVAGRVVESGLSVILAGGLNPENISRAVEEVHPWGVDVSSGVEVSPGVKDQEKVRRFVELSASGANVEK